MKLYVSQGRGFNRVAPYNRCVFSLQSVHAINKACAQPVSERPCNQRVRQAGQWASLVYKAPPSTLGFKEIRNQSNSERYATVKKYIVVSGHSKALVQRRVRDAYIRFILCLVRFRRRLERLSIHLVPLLSGIRYSGLLPPAPPVFQ